MSTSANPRPQLTLDELFQLKWLLGGVLSLLAVWSVFYLEIDAFVLTLITTLVVPVAMVRPDWLARVPRLVHVLAFPAMVTFFLGDLWFTGQVLPPTVRLGILLLLYRSISYRQRRDDLQIIVLGLFLIVVAGVLTVSLVFAVQILAFTACALGFLLTITLTEAAEGGHKTTSAAAKNEVPGWARVEWRRFFARLRQSADWRVLTVGGVLFAGVVAVSILLFLAIPRFQLENSLFLERFVSKKARTGFSDNIKFGDVTDIQQDDSPALRVDISDQAQIPATPYWRMVVLDEYREGTFRMSPGLRRSAFSEERQETNLRGTERPRVGAPVYWTFYLEPGVSRYLPLPGAFELLRFREPQNARRSDELRLVAMRDEPVTMTAYRLEGVNAGGVQPDPTLAARLKEWRATGRARMATMLRAGVGEPDLKKLQTLVTEIAGPSAVSAEEFAKRVCAWLAQHHSYSLQPAIPSGEGDPLVRWLAGSGGGHCELFAGSFTLLARVTGRPARVVTGFKGGSWNAFSGNFTIRNSDAHAWCELYDEAAGVWLRVDPTPGSAAVPGADTPGAAALARRFDRSWTARLDSLRVFWYRRIVNFDQRSQLETLRAVKEVTQNSGKEIREALDRALERLKTWLLAPWDGRRIAEVFAALALVIGAIWGWREFGRGWWRQLGLRRRQGKLDPVRREAGRWLEKIVAEQAAADGVPQWRRETPELRGTVAELQRLRYGARATWPEPEQVFRRARAAWRELRRGARVGRS